MIPGVPMSTMLPEATRNALVAASEVDDGFKPGDERAVNRIAALDAATTAARARNPEMFQ